MLKVASTIGIFLTQVTIHTGDTRQMDTVVASSMDPHSLQYRIRNFTNR